MTDMSMADISDLVLDDSAAARDQTAKPIPPRAFKVDATMAWEIVRASRGDAQKLPLSDFTDAVKEKRPGSVRFVCISDTHSKNPYDAIPDGDVLLHCGDFSQTGTLEEVAKFAEWFGSLPHARKILIAGNHDLALHGASYGATSVRFGHGVADVAGTCAKARALIDAIPNCEYLCDSGTIVAGLRIWGSPWTPAFCGWAFNQPRGAESRQRWRLIPSDTDILLTHGPPLGHGDETSRRVRAGCLDLLDEIQTRIKPRYHCFGHIHEGHGVTTDGTTTFVNASTCNLRYQASNAPFVFDVDPPSSAPQVDAEVAASAIAASAPADDAMAAAAPAVAPPDAPADDASSLLRRAGAALDAFE